MRYIILSALFILFCRSESIAQYSISPRVGEVIDQNEREYFGLFPTIEGFVSAKATVKSNHQIEFVINRAVGGVNSDTAFSISSTVTQNLVNYIEDFESVRGNKRSVNWSLLQGLASSSSTSIESKINDGGVIIETTLGMQLQGKLVCVGDSSLILMHSRDQFNWRTFGLFERTIHFSDIDNIIIERESYFREGLGYGTLVGALGTTALVAFGLNSRDQTGQAIFFGGVTIIGSALLGSAIGAIEGIDINNEVQGNYNNYQQSLSLLRENVMFTSFPPPEIQRLQDSLTAARDKNVGLETSVSGQSQNVAPPNLIYLELLGNGGGFSVNYERRFLQNFSARIGIGAFESYTVPILAYYFINFGRGNIQLGAGVTLEPHEEQFASATASIGYRYQSKYSGLMFEIAFTPIFGDYLVPLVGIAGGYTF